MTDATPARLSSQDVATAADFWLAGRDTYQIATHLGVPEPVVAASTDHIRAEANRKRSRLHSH